MSEENEICGSQAAILHAFTRRARDDAVAIGVGIVAERDVEAIAEPDHVAIAYGEEHPYGSCRPSRAA